MMTKEEMSKQLEVQISLASEILGAKEPIKNIPYKQLINIICEVAEIDPEVIKMKTRKREIVQARQLFYFYMKNNTNLSLAEIGKRAGGFNHATVLHGIKTITNLSRNNKGIKGLIDEIDRLV